MHLGLIGGIGPAATEFYYRGLIDRHAAAGTCPDLTIAHADVRDMVRNLAARDPGAQAAIFARLVQRLKAAGAEAAVVTSMGGHFCIKELEAISPLPMINGVNAVAEEIARRGLKSIGIMGTRMVMESGLYGRLTSIRVVLPEGEALQKVHETYGAMASVGRITEAQCQFFHAAGRALVDRGAEAVLLGGTDLFLAFQGDDPGYPVLDSADIHVEAVYRRSLAG
ncbi:aspartate/glutamate racemase family protein [Desertibaculum subflavum]|uniref:aspartate/glutamate racemase family protein n=1 Tax=Desertibaculum subflavum TaxID=2268458 RepID=UPI000E6679DF